MPTISIIIAAYNAAAFIDRAIQSALNQSVLPHEIIVVNDASTDHTATVLDAIAAEHSRVKVHHLATNGGPSAARNKGLQVASGEWGAGLDADDAIAETFVATVTEAITTHQPDIVATNFYWFDVARNTHLEKGLNQTENATTVSKYQFVNGARPYSQEADYGLLKPVFRLALLREHNLQYSTTIRHGEDFMLLAQVLFFDARFVVLNAPLYLYTTRDSGLSQTIPNYPKMAQDTLDLLALPSVKNDQKLMALLKLRAKSLRRLNAQILFNRHIGRRELGTIGHHLLRDGAYRQYAFKYAAKKLLRR